MCRRILGLSLLFLFSALFASQVEVKIIKEYKKGAGEIGISGKNYDQAWNGIIRSLMNLNFRIKESSKETGSIIAQKKPGIFTEDGDVLESLDIQVIKEENILIVVSYNQGSELVSSGKNIFNKLYEKIKEIMEKE